MRYYKETKATNFSQDPRVFTAVKEIVERVRAEGDAAVSDYNVKFGGQAASSFLVPQSELDRADAENAEEERAAQAVTLPAEAKKEKKKDKDGKKDKDRKEKDKKDKEKKPKEGKKEKKGGEKA